MINESGRIPVWAAAILFCCICSSLLAAGTFQDSTFTSINDSALSKDSGGLLLRIQYPNTMVKTYDSTPPIRSPLLHNPEVTVTQNNHFRFFWTDSQAIVKTYTLRSMDVALTDTIATAESPSLNLAASLRHPIYLHADAGDSCFFISTIENTSDLKGIGKYNRNSTATYGAISDSSIFHASQCHYKGNDFFIAYETHGTTIYVKRISIKNNSLFDIDSQEFPVAQAQNTCANLSIAVDSAKNILVVWERRKLVTSPKQLYYACFHATSNTLDPLVQTTLLDDTVDNAAPWNRYDDASVVSYGSGKFASANWKSSGIQMHLFEVMPALPHDTLGVRALQVTSQPDSRFPTLAVNNRYLIVLWIEKSLPNSLFLKGVRYTLSSLIDNAPPKDTIVNIEMSKTGNPNDTAILNCAMDSSGNVGLCYGIDDSVHLKTLSLRNLYYAYGSSLSRSFLIQQGLTDSIGFVSGTIAGPPNPQNTTIEDSIFVSSDSGTIGKFFSLNDGEALKNNTKGLYNYFRYKISLKSSNDFFKTPKVRKITLNWNAKPRFDSLLSVTIGSSTQSNVKFGDTVVCRSRIDSVTCRFSMYDADSSDTLFPEIDWLSQSRKDTLRGFAHRLSSLSVAPLFRSDTVITCRFSAHDAKNWFANDRVLYIKTRNVSPVLSVRAVYNANPPLAMTKDTSLQVQQSDSIEFFYSMTDSNDPGIKCCMYKNDALINCTKQDTVNRFFFRFNQEINPHDNFVFRANDTNTLTSISVLCGVNHFPKIDSFSVSGNPVRSNDTLRIVPGLLSPIVIHASDLDVGYWDTLTYIVRRGNRDTILKDPVFAYIPDRFDTVVTMITHDKFGVRDSMRFFMKFPWYATDSLENTGLTSAKKTLTGVSEILGAGQSDTIALPIKNTGNDTLSILSLRFTGGDRRWSNMLVQKDGALRLYHPSDSGTLFPLRAPPESTIIFYTVFTPDSLKGDGLLYDTIIIGLNDYRKGADTLPIRLEYNDLPLITDYAINLVKQKPYWLAKRTRKNGSPAQKFTFPPYTKLSLFFSEPMDSLSALGPIQAYSVFDSIANKGIIPIPLIQTWASGKTRVDLSPLYSQSSPYFHLKPMPGLFIPTDSIRIVISSALTDTAKTPSGPNGLDVHRVAKRSALVDTAFSFRVDSVKFTVTSTFPNDATTGVVPYTQLALTFSSAPLPSTIDTRLIDNRMFLVWSSYHSASTIGFSRISLSGDSIIFVPTKRFFYGDTVRCRYRSLWARDSSGYSVDNNKDGIPIAMFAPDSTQDDKQWFFVIKNLRHSDVFPMNGEKNASSKTALRISFSDTIMSSAIDTSLHGNRTLLIVSRCNKGAPIDFDSVRLSGTSAIFYPAHALFYEDIVNCFYRGLSTNDTAMYAFDATQGRPLLVNDSLQWSFSIKPIKLLSVMPETSSTASSIHPEITLSFSDPIFIRTFDTDTSSGNRSFKLTSSYSQDSALAYKSIVFSADRSQVIIRPKTTFLSNDSLHCIFNGFTGDFVYGASDNLPGNGTTIGRSEWHFFIRTEEFYTFPNPYKPGTDPRHCSAGGPCGIWFKNLHVLKSDISEVSIKIFSIYAHPLYSTQAAGIRIQFQTGNPLLRPEWKWDTRNQHGDLVASGLYLYAIYDPQNTIIMKGKLMIVR